MNAESAADLTDDMSSTATHAACVHVRTFNSGTLHRASPLTTKRKLNITTCARHHHHHQQQQQQQQQHVRISTAQSAPYSHTMDDRYVSAYDNRLDHR